ncbi:MAG TPA: hypothetical protein VK824_06235, partial [Planctomycetota bacterium]|nr:hypothetical protein [Planctomycetota bacterium]
MEVVFMDKFLDVGGENAADQRGDRRRGCNRRAIRAEAPVQRAEAPPRRGASDSRVPGARAAGRTRGKTYK